MKNKNILFVQNSISIADGGVPRVSDIVCQELRKRSHQCFFCFHGNDNPAYPAAYKLRLSLKSRQAAQDQLVKFIMLNDIDIIICQNAYSNTYINLFRAIKKDFPSIKLYTFLHASPNYWLNYNLKEDSFDAKSDYKTKLKNKLKSFIYPIYNPYLLQTKRLYQLSDQFFLLSESFKESFQKIYLHNQDSRKLKTLTNPTTYPFYAEHDSISGKEKTVLIVSRLKEDQKKISLAIKAWSMLPDKTTSQWKLVIVGSGPDEERYKLYVKQLNVKNVFFEGHQNDVLAYYKSASIFLMTSVWEGLPMSLLEAQQNGVVPIVFDTFSAVRDLIEDGKTGLIIKANDLVSYANGIEMLINSNTMRLNMAQQAVNSSKNFDVYHIADQWETHLNHN